MFRIFTSFFFFLILSNSNISAQDTLITWYDDSFIGKIIKINKQIISFEMQDELGKTYRIHTSELQKAIYEDGKVIYFFEEYPDIVKRFKKSSPKKKKVCISPISAPFNHFYVGYEHMISKNQSLEYQLGFIHEMLMPSNKNAKGAHANIIWKSIFTEPMRISGLSVRPKMQGAFYGFMFSLNYVHYIDDISYPSDSLYHFTTENKKINSLIPTLHFIFGYNQMIAPSLMLTFSSGIGGGPELILSKDQQIKKYASLPNIAIGSQRFIAQPFSLNAMITLGFLLR